jgi:hypothetical protein
MAGVALFAADDGELVVNLPTPDPQGLVFYN